MNNLQRLILDFIWLVLNPRERSNKQISDIEKGNKRIRLHNLSRNLLVKKLARNSKQQNFFSQFSKRVPSYYTSTTIIQSLNPKF